jgi:hypothetical protein
MRLALFMVEEAQNVAAELLWLIFRIISCLTITGHMSKPMRSASYFIPV